MVTLASLLAACLDPLEALLVLTIVIAYRGPLPTVMAGTAGALITETARALAAGGHVWGDLIAPRLVASLLQAAVATLAVWAIRSAARRAWAPLGAEAEPASAAGWRAASPTPDALEPRSLPPRLALWHMRAYAHFNSSKLHKKKNAAFDCESL